jgi:hypothetical protein
LCVRFGLCEQFVIVHDFHRSPALRLGIPIINFTPAAAAQCDSGFSNTQLHGCNTYMLYRVDYRMEYVEYGHSTTLNATPPPGARARSRRAQASPARVVECRDDCCTAVFAQWPMPSWELPTPHHAVRTPRVRSVSTTRPTQRHRHAARHLASLHSSHEMRDTTQVRPVQQTASCRMGRSRNLAPSPPGHGCPRSSRLCWPKPASPAGCRRSVRTGGLRA